MAFSVVANPPPSPPVPPRPDVVRFENGLPTRAHVEFEQKQLQFQRDMIAWMKLIAAAIP